MRASPQTSQQQAAVLLFCVASGGFSAACGGVDTPATTTDGTVGSTATTPTATTTPVTSATDGCIQVDGLGDHPTIASAIAAASPGQTVTVCALGRYEETVVVDRSVILQGPGPDALTLVAPINTTAITVTADDAVVSGFTLETTRSGLSVDGARGVHLQDITVTNAPGWGLSADDAEELTATQLTITGAGYGGVNVDGGSAYISASEIVANHVQGIFVSDAALTLSESTIADTLATDSTASTGGSTSTGTTSTGTTSTGTTSTGTTSTEGTPTDGYGIFLEDWATATLEGNTFTGNPLTHIAADQADVHMTGDTLDGGLVGMWVISGEATLDGVVITDAYRYGAVFETPWSVTLTGVEISGDRDLTIETTDDEWGGDSLGYSGTGLLAVVDELTMTDSAVRGYAGAGAVLAEYTDGAAHLERVTFEDNARHGLVLEGIDTTAIDVAVTGLVMAEEQGDDTCYFVDRYVGVYADDNTLTWTGGEITGNGGYGVTGSGANLQISGATISGNTCAGVMDFYGAVTLTDSDLSQPGTVNSLAASVVAYYSLGATLSGNHFHDSAITVLDEQTGDAHITYEVSTTAGRDVYGRGTADLVIEGNTFEAGSSGLYISGCGGEITGNTWLGYDQTPAEMYESDILFSDNTLDGFGYYGVYCSDGAVEIEDSTFSNGTQFDWSYETFERGESLGVTEVSEVGYAVYGYNCSLDVHYSDFADLPGSAVRARTYGSSDVSELGDLLIERTVTSELASYPPVYVYVSSDAGSAHAVSMEDVQILDAGQLYGMYFWAPDNPLDVRIDDVELTGSASYGLFLSGSGVSATADAVSISGTGSDGIVVYDGSALEMTDSSITDSASSGLWVYSASASVSQNTLTGNAGYGMYCSSAAVTCEEANDLSGNVAGEMYGCPATCAGE